MVKITGRVELPAGHRAGTKHRKAECLNRCTDCSQCGPIKSRDGSPTQVELVSGHLQVTAISLPVTIFTAELEQVQQTPGSPVALARESLLTKTSSHPHTGSDQWIKTKKTPGPLVLYSSER